MGLCCRLILPGSQLGHGGRQRDRVRVARMSEDVLEPPGLDDFAQIHHGDRVSDVLHDAEVVRDEEIGEALFAAELAEQIEQLGLHGHIERGDGARHRSAVSAPAPGRGDADALPLAARELMGVAVRCIGIYTHSFERPAAATLLAGASSSRSAVSRGLRRRSGVPCGAG